MKHLTEMKPGETLHLRSGRDLELESVTPVTCGVMLTFNVTERKEHNNERYAKIITFILQSEPGTSLRAAGWTLEAAKAGKPRWNKERYAAKPVQLSLFPSKQPPAEYKQRWAKALNQKEDTTT